MAPSEHRPVGRKRSQEPHVYTYRCNNEDLGQRSVGHVEDCSHFRGMLECLRLVRWGRDNSYSSATPVKQSVKERYDFISNLHWIFTLKQTSHQLRFLPGYRSTNSQRSWNAHTTWAEAEHPSCSSASSTRCVSLIWTTEFSRILQRGNSLASSVQPVRSQNTLAVHAHLITRW